MTMAYYRLISEQGRQVLVRVYDFRIGVIGYVRQINRFTPTKSRINSTGHSFLLMNFADATADTTRRRSQHDPQGT